MELYHKLEYPKVAPSCSNFMWRVVSPYNAFTGVQTAPLPNTSSSKTRYVCICLLRRTIKFTLPREKMRNKFVFTHGYKRSEYRRAVKAKASQKIVVIPGMVNIWRRKSVGKSTTLGEKMVKNQWKSDWYSVMGWSSPDVETQSKYGWSMKGQNLD